MLKLNYFRLAKLPMLLFVLAACPGVADPPRVCESNTSRCDDRGRPQVCLSTGEWQDTARESCPTDTSCCLIVGIAGRPIHGCARPTQCLPEDTGQPTYAPPPELATGEAQ